MVLAADVRVGPLPQYESMRGSDFVDVTFEVLPRRLVQFLVLIAIASMSLTGWWKPVEWYINDKAVGYTEVLSDIATSIDEDDTNVGTSNTGENHE